MIDINQLAETMAIHMAKEAALERNKIEQLRYGLEIILGALIKGAVLFTLAYLLNILPHVAVALAAAGLFRLLSGGVHCTSYWRCLTLGVTVYLLIGLVVVNIANLITVTTQTLTTIAGITILVSATCTIKWVPGEVPYRTMTGQREKNKFKILSLLYLLLWTGVIIYLLNITKNPTSYILAALMPLAMQTISFTPWGYKLVTRADKLMVKITS